MVLESLRQALKEEGIEEIPAEGETFDPNLHQSGTDRTCDRRCACGYDRHSIAKGL